MIRIGFLLIFLASTFATGQPDLVPKIEGTGAPEALAVLDQVVVISVDFDRLVSRTEITISLGESPEVDLIPQDLEDHSSLGVQSIAGRLSDGGSFVLAHGLGGSSGALWTAAGTWELVGRGETDELGRLILNASLVNGPDAECSGALVAGRMENKVSGTTKADSTQRGADPEDIVRVLIVYDPFAAVEIGDINAYAASLVGSANQAYINSGVSPMRLELVGTETIGAVTTSDSGELLRRLTNRYDGNLDIVHPLREAYDADLVALIVDLPSFCGRAWIRPEDDHYGFSVSDTDCALGNLTFAHELGHNFGCSHDADNAATPFLPYGLGHRWNSNQWRSVMAYSPGSRVPYFSNPLISFDGAPTGIADEHDNSRVLNLMDITIANMRTGDGFSLDCNANLIPDRVEIALDPSLDLDRDVQIDTCQISSDPSLDCNNDDVLDSEQVSQRVHIDLGPAQPFGDGQPVFLTSMPLVQPDTDVKIIVAAEGDLGASSEFVTLDFNGGTLELQAYATTGIDCFSPGIIEEFSVPASVFSTVADEGVLLVVTSSKSINPTLCSSETNLRVAIEYRTNNTELDTDADGIIDSCGTGCPADLTGEGELDVFDVFVFLNAFNTSDSAADFTGDGLFDIFDVFAFLDAFNAGCP